MAINTHIYTFRQHYKLLTCMFLLPLLSFAQEKSGITFQTGKTVAEIQALAKAEKKLIFIDVYTDWCGPCKLMDQEVFPQAKVGLFYNQSFINYKIDAEKGEGIALSKKYNVQSYPNYIFINADGELIYRVTGSMEANNFIQHGKNALEESKDSITVASLDKLYPEKKGDKIFMHTYLERLTKIKRPTTNLLEEYVSLLNKQEQGSDQTIKLLINNAVFTNSQIKLGPAFNVLKENEETIKKLVSQKEIKAISLSQIKTGAIENSLELAITNKDENLLRDVLTLMPSFDENKFDNKSSVKLDYYYRTKNYKKFVIEAKEYVNNHLLKIPADSLKKWDAETYTEVKKAILERDKRRNKELDEELFTYLYTQSIEFARNLIRYSEQILQAGTNISDFKNAEKWSLEAVKIARTDKKYYQSVYPRFRLIYAKACYKTNQKTFAIKEIEDTIKELPDFLPPSRREEFISALVRMKANELL